MTDGGVDYSFEAIGNVKTMVDACSPFCSNSTFSLTHSLFLQRAALECCHKGWGEVHFFFPRCSFLPFCVLLVLSSNCLVSLPSLELLVLDKVCIPVCLRLFCTTFWQIDCANRNFYSSIPSKLCRSTRKINRSVLTYLLVLQLVTGRVWRGSAFGGVKGRSQLPTMVNNYLAGDLKIDEYITHRMPLEDINKAFDYMKQGKRSTPPPTPFFSLRSRLMFFCCCWSVIQHPNCHHVRVRSRTLPPMHRILRFCSISLQRKTESIMLQVMSMDKYHFSDESVQRSSCRCGMGCRDCCNSSGGCSQQR